MLTVVVCVKHCPVRSETPLRCVFKSAHSCFLADFVWSSGPTSPKPFTTPTIPSRNVSLPVSSNHKAGRKRKKIIQCDVKHQSNV